MGQGHPCRLRQLILQAVIASAGSFTAISASAFTPSKYKFCICSCIGDNKTIRDLACSTSSCIDRYKGEILRGNLSTPSYCSRGALLVARILTAFAQS